MVAVSTMGAPGAPLSAELDAVWAAPAGPQGAREMLGRLVFDQALVTESAVASRAQAMQAGASAFASVFPPPRARWAEDLTLSVQTLGEIGAPVLLVHGAEDRVTPLRSAALPLLEHLADVQLHVLGRCGHVPAVERPARLPTSPVGVPPSGLNPDRGGPQPLRALRPVRAGCRPSWENLPRVVDSGHLTTGH